MTEDIEIFSRIVRPGAALILSKFYVQYPVEFVLYGPMTAFGIHDLSGRHAFSTVDKIVGLVGWYARDPRLRSQEAWDCYFDYILDELKI